MRQAFFAYPSRPQDLRDTIESAVEASNRRSSVRVTPWATMDVFGRYIPDEVRGQINSAHVVVCDITQANENVYYECGFGIGLGKTVLPVINSSFSRAVSEAQRDGIFDNIGFRTYDNADQLAHILSSVEEAHLRELYAKPVNTEQPLYFLNAFRKTDFVNAIASAIKTSRVFFRSFDPAEIPRFSSVNIIAESTASSGAIVPFLASHVDDAERHNLRAAFLAGIMHGLGRDVLMLRLKEGDDKDPADFRDMIRTASSPAAVPSFVVEFAKNCQLLAPRLVISPSQRPSRSALQNLSLGASAAENEFRTLETYFVQTSEYLRTARGEVNVVAGRKGSGKTAIFFMVRNHFREQKFSIVTDLKPESHQLSLFREELLKSADAGVFDHTLVAFWYFVILSEILLTLRRDLEHRSRVDPSVFDDLKDVDLAMGGLAVSEGGDFTSRMARLTDIIVKEIKQRRERRQALTPDFLTGIVFKDGINKVRALISRLIDDSGHIVLLFDNIDKGWPTKGVDVFDIRLVRLLIEALDKIKRDFRSLNREFLSAVFLRNDIYELLVEDTPDRQKAAQVRIDWTDRAKLRQVIFNRLRSGIRSPGSFSEVWATYFCDHVNGVSSFDYFLDHCLMRPRFLINIIEYAIANAINRGHSKVTADDCSDAVKQHSYYLVDDFGYEIRDVSGLPADILYSLVGIETRVRKETIIERFIEFGIEPDRLEDAFNLMLWYGVIGIVNKANQDRFIYDVEYNMKRILAEIRNMQDPLYATNAAIHVALRDV